MTMSEQGDDEEMFKYLISDIDFTFDADMLKMVPYSELSKMELVDKMDDACRFLEERGELLDPKTPEGIDAHAVYHGAMLELRRRGLAL